MMQEYSDDADRLMPSGSIPIKRIEKLPLPYTGNKKKLAAKIQDSLLKHGVEFNSVLDAFSGTGTISFLFKLMGKRVISNELLTSSYLNSVAFVENPGIKLSDDEKEFLLFHDNPNKNTFVEDNYLGEKFRSGSKKCRFSKFTLKECRHLDNFRSNIDEICGIHSQSLGLAANAAVVLRLPFGNADQSIDIMKHRIKQNEKYGKTSNNHDRRIGIYYDDELNLRFDKWFKKYLDDFTRGMQCDKTMIDKKVKSASFLANLQQHVLRDCMVQGRLHHGQALAELNVRLSHQKNQLKGNWDNQGSTEMDFYTNTGKPGQGMKWWTFADMEFSGSAIATNMDVTELLKLGFCNVDCAYFDPPYGGQSSDYGAIYRFFEEFIYSKKIEDLPHITNYVNKFVEKKNYEENFVNMLSAAVNIPIWLFSYNDSSWKDIEYICDVIKQFKKSIIVDVLSDQYRYLYRSKQGRTKKSSEYLIIAR